MAGRQRTRPALHVGEPLQQRACLPATTPRRAPLLCCTFDSPRDLSSCTTQHASSPSFPYDECCLLAVQVLELMPDGSLFDAVIKANSAAGTAGPAANTAAKLPVGLTKRPSATSLNGGKRPSASGAAAGSSAAGAGPSGAPGPGGYTDAQVSRLSTRVVV